VVSEMQGLQLQIQPGAHSTTRERQRARPAARDQRATPHPSDPDAHRETPDRINQPPNHSVSVAISYGSNRSGHTRHKLQLTGGRTHPTKVFLITNSRGSPSYPRIRTTDPISIRDPEQSIDRSRSAMIPNGRNALSMKTDPRNFPFHHARSYAKSAESNRSLAPRHKFRSTRLTEKKDPELTHDGWKFGR
jgi:hypothetical protein